MDPNLSQAHISFVYNPRTSRRRRARVRQPLVSPAVRSRILNSARKTGLRSPLKSVENAGGISLLSSPLAKFQLTIPDDLQSNVLPPSTSKSHDISIFASSSTAGFPTTQSASPNVKSNSSDPTSPNPHFESPKIQESEEPSFLQDLNSSIQYLETHPHSDTDLHKLIPDSLDPEMAFHQLVLLCLSAQLQSHEIPPELFDPINEICSQFLDEHKQQSDSNSQRHFAALLEAEMKDIQDQLKENAKLSNIPYSEYLQSLNDPLADTFSLNDVEPVSHMDNFYSAISILTRFVQNHLELKAL